MSTKTQLSHKEMSQWSSVNIVIRSFPDKASVAICPEYIQAKAVTINWNRRVRDSRENQRRLLRLSQEVYRLKIPDFDSRNTEMVRNKLNHYRNLIMEFEDKYQTYFTLDDIWSI